MSSTEPTTQLPQILLLTHGGWGTQLCDSLRMVTGEIAGVSEIALMPVDTLGEFLSARRSGRAGDAGRIADF